MRSVRERLPDILEAIDRIQRYTVRGRAAFEQDELIQMWMVSHIQMIGEACRALPMAVQDDHPEIPWRAIIGMRNIPVHHYSEVDLDAVWLAVDRDLPRLRAVVSEMLGEFPPTGEN
ncbi:MAG: DUF86 domain-containing protein [Anaerolineae bacterium]|nr:DUF86 domain-containing protein [Anaerolineae bacterium]